MNTQEQLTEDERLRAALDQVRAVVAQVPGWRDPDYTPLEAIRDILASDTPPRAVCGQHAGWRSDCDACLGKTLAGAPVSGATTDWHRVAAVQSDKLQDALECLTAANARSEAAERAEIQNGNTAHRNLTRAERAESEAAALRAEVVRLTAMADERGASVTKLVDRIQAVIQERDRALTAAAESNAEAEQLRAENLKVKADGMRYAASLGLVENAMGIHGIAPTSRVVTLVREQTAEAAALRAEVERLQARCQDIEARDDGLCALLNESESRLAAAEVLLREAVGVLTYWNNYQATEGQSHVPEEENAACLDGIQRFLSYATPPTFTSLVKTRTAAEQAVLDAMAAIPDEDLEWTIELHADAPSTPVVGACRAELTLRDLKP